MNEESITPDEFAKLWHAGETLDRLAARIGVSRATVMRYAKRLGLPSRGQLQRKPDPTPDEIAERCRELRERHLADRLAEDVNVTRCRAWRHR